MNKKEKIISSLAIIFALVFLANYAYVSTSNSSKVRGEFELLSICDLDGEVIVSGVKNIGEKTNGVAISDDIKMVFDKSGYFLIQNFEEGLAGSFEVQKTMFNLKTLKITLEFTDDSESIAALSTKYDEEGNVENENYLIFAHGDYVYTFAK